MGVAAGIQGQLYCVGARKSGLALRRPALAVPSPQRGLDLSGLRAGFYLLRLASKDGALVRQPTIK